MRCRQMIEYAWLSSFSGNIAAMGVAAGGYVVYRLIRRIRCASHTNCCDIELVKPETQRGMEAPVLSDIIKALRTTKENYAGPHAEWRADAVPLDDARGRKRPEGEVVALN